MKILKKFEGIPWFLTDITKKLKISLYFLKYLPLGGIILIFTLPFFKTVGGKVYGIPLWLVNTILLAVSLLILIVIGIIYGLHKKIKIPKFGAATKKFFKRLCCVTAILVIWWFWYPIKKLVLPIFEERPGVEQKATTNDNKKGVDEVAKQKEKEEKTSYYLKWEKPKNTRKKYSNISQEKFEVIFSEKKDGVIKFTIKNPSRSSDETSCSLQRFNKRESCGTWNGKEIYNETDTVWAWKGDYVKIHTGETGTLYLKESQSGNIMYKGKISLPNYHDEWINLVIYQERR